MKRFLTFLAAALLGGGVAAFAQFDENIVSWKASSQAVSDGQYEVVLTGSIAKGWHTYSLESGTEFILSQGEGFTLVGEPYEIGTPQELNGEKVYFGEIRLAQKIRLNAASAKVSGTVTWQSCSDGKCLSPEDFDFSLDIKAAVSDNVEAVLDNVEPVSDNAEAVLDPASGGHSTAIADPLTEESQKAGGSLWGLIIEAILWGFAMLLTPCVFPMIPMTISFFMKGSSSVAAGRFKAFMYGLFIVLLYTVPISAIIGLTWLLGGDSVTADIFNWLATHWLPNIIFFAVFMIFAASFFGAFEITLPSSIVNKSDQNSDKKGLAGIFFMALTLVLVSFSCTGPIVGSVLIKSTQGEFWAPMVTMLAFSVAFALPFTIFALFPSLLSKIKHGGGAWLNSVKVVLGFIEIAFGLKFLSVPDQTYHWHLLDREVYLAIWIVVFTLLGLYLLGKIRFANDEKVEHLGVFRLTLVVAVFSFVVYMVPGMFGAPLKALSGYLPPMETQDFVIYSHADGVQIGTSSPAETTSATIDLPLGLKGYNTIDEGLKEAARQGKPLFVDITGHGCTNCREMEQRVWSDPKVLKILREDYIITALYTDDKTRLPEKDWLTTESGKVLKDLGRVNSYIVRTRFGVNAQPNYAILSHSGEQVLPIRGYNTDVDAFVDFLERGIQRSK